MSTKLEIVDSEGNERSFRSAENIADNTETGIEKAFWRSGKSIHKKFGEQVRDKSSKTGLIYKLRSKSGRRINHQSSAEDESPANRRGFKNRSKSYLKGASFIVRGSEELVFGNSAAHAGYLEGGTPRMKPRPGLANAVGSSHKNLLRNFATEMEEQL